MGGRRQQTLHIQAFVQNDEDRCLLEKEHAEMRHFVSSFFIYYTR